MWWVLVIVIIGEQELQNGLISNIFEFGLISLSIVVVMVLVVLIVISILVLGLQLMLKWCCCWVVMVCCSGVFLGLGGYWLMLLVMVFWVVCSIFGGLFLLGKFCFRLIVLIWVVSVDILVNIVVVYGCSCDIVMVVEFIWVMMCVVVIFCLINRLVGGFVRVLVWDLVLKKDLNFFLWNLWNRKLICLKKFLFMRLFVFCVVNKRMDCCMKLSY